MNKFGSKGSIPVSYHPTSCFALSNLGITMAYFSVGLVMSFVSTPLNVYLVEQLDAEPKMQTTMSILQTLPWSLKLIFGFLSDAVPIFGMHRKPYLAIGALVYSGSFLLYAFSTTEDVFFLAVCIFFGTLGLITMDVMCDTMCVERSRFEPDAIKGQMQATYYTVRFGGGILGSMGGALLYNKESWGWGLTFRQIAFINGMIPICLLAPTLCWLVEKYKRHRLADGRKLIVPFSYDVSALSTYKSVGAKLAELANEQTPLLASDVQKSLTKSGINRLHPTAQVSVPHHSHGGVAHKTTSDFGGGTDEEKQKLNITKGVMGEDEDSDGSDDLETGLQLQPVLRPPAGQVKGVGMSGMALESHVAKHPHHHGQKGILKPSAVATGDQTYGSITASENTTSEPVSPPVDDDDDDDDENDGSLFKNVLNQLDDIWNTVQLKAVWRPMAFVYVFNIMQVPNVAWQSYLQLTLHFEPYILGLMVAVGSVMTFAGVVAYKYVFFKVSWRKIYIWSTILVTFFGMMQLCLVAQWNIKYLHMNNYIFSLGDDVLSSYISGIQFLPLCIMYMKLCPEGSEGASYSMLTTFSNIAVVCASNVGNLMAGIWDVSNHAMKHNELSGLWNLTFLTSIVNIFPLILLRLLPNSAEEQEELSKCKDQSKTGGIIFLLILFGSIIWSFSTALSQLV